MKIYLLFALTLLISYSVTSQVTQWRGTVRDGHFSETGLLKEWPENGPELVFEVENLGKGYSSPIVTSDAIFITGMKDTLDYLTKLDINGTLLWQVPYGRSWNKSYPDSRSSATIDSNRVYVQSGTGRVSCFDTADGKELWTIDVDKDFETEYHIWGNSETPLIVDNMVIATPGGSKTSVVAFDKYTGELIWQSKSVGGPRSYVSPTIYENSGFRFIIAVTGTNIMALNPENGTVAWSYYYFDEKYWPWGQNGLIWTNTPVFSGNDFFISKGYDYPAVMLQMDSTGTSVSPKFTDHTFDNHHHGLILHEGFLYGSNWQSNSKGKWVCMKWDTGEIKYVSAWGSKGSMIMADDMLYAYNERGNVGLIEPDPDEFKIISQFKIRKGSGPHWAHPFIANGNLYLRHGEVLMVYNLKAL